MSRQLRWSPSIPLPLVGPLHYVFMPCDFNVQRFRKLGFCLVSFNATLTLVGQICKTLNRDSLGGVPISTLVIHTW